VGARARPEAREAGICTAGCTAEVLREELEAGSRQIGPLGARPQNN